MFQNRGEWGILILRVIVGVIFIIAGWTKVQGIEQTIGFFAQTGISPFWTYAVAYLELLGGLAVLLGFYTRIAGYILSVIMVGAIYFATAKMGFSMGYSQNLLIIASLLAIGWNKSALSLAGSVCGCAKCMMCGGSMTEKEGNM